MKTYTTNRKGILHRLTRLLGAMLTVAFMVPAVAVSQPLAPVNLGTAGNFVILTKSGISTTGVTSIVGDIGVSPIASTAITGFGLIADPSNTFSTSSLVTGNIYAADYAPPTPANMTTAVSDMETAYTNAAGRTLPDATELGAGNISGLTLAPGLYKWSSGVTIPNGVTLSGSTDDVWIFQIAGTLTVSSGAIVTLSGGAQAKNIFWQVAGQTTLGTYADFKGIILCQTAIVLNTGATLDGRALAQTAVTLDANTISLNTGATGITYTVMLSSNPAAGGTTSGGGTFNSGSSVTVTATPNAGYTFTNWTENGIEVSTNASYQFTISGNRTLVANFTAMQYTVTLSSNPAAGGTTSGGGTFNSGSSVTVTATANAGYTFTNWTENGTAVSTNASYTFTISGNSTLVANFALAGAGSQAPVNLGTAGNFVILTKSGISTTGTTSIVGDIGVSPIASTAITGFGLIADPSNTFSTSSLVTGNIYAADYAPPTPANLTTAVSDMEIAYTNTAGRTLPDATELGAGNISGLTLAPGLYKWSSGVTIPNGVTLSGSADDVWIFQIAQTLTVGNGAVVTLSGGAQAKNIFWQVAGQTTLGTYADFKGIILCQTAIVLNTGATLDGRALAQTAVTLDANSITANEGATLEGRALARISTVTSVENDVVPQAFSLDQNYPNPFNPSTKIQYTIGNPGLVSLKVYDVLGNEVATLVNSNQEAGSYTVSFNTNEGKLNLASGMYFYRLEAGSFVSIKKLILLK